MEKSPRIQTAEFSTNVEHEVENIINGTCIVLQMQFGVNIEWTRITNSMEIASFTAVLANIYPT